MAWFSDKGFVDGWFNAIDTSSSGSFEVGDDMLIGRHGEVLERGVLGLLVGYWMGLVGKN